MGISMYGDWAKAGQVLKALALGLSPLAKAKMQEDGKLILDTMIKHIEKQDLSWAPLSNTTIRLKNGDETIYVETGYLKENLGIRQIKSSKDDFSIFIGASPWKTTNSGLKFSDLMLYLEYGTSSIPARPLIRPTWEELRPKLEQGWVAFMQDLINKGGR